MFALHVMKNAQILFLLRLQKYPDLYNNMTPLPTTKQFNDFSDWLQAGQSSFSVEMR